MPPESIRTAPPGTVLLRPWMNLLLLLATLIALPSGPLLYALARYRFGLLSFLDGFVLVAISGLVLLEVLPETLASGGLAAVSFLLLGALGPTLFERQLHRAREAHIVALLLSVAGLVMHSVADGTALAPSPDGSAHVALALAICVHSVPVGLAVWWLLYPSFGWRLPGAAIAAMGLGTVFGYTFADALGGWLGASAWSWLQALVAGSILHVIFGRPHLDAASSERLSRPPYEGLGNLAAAAALWLLELLHPEGHADAPTGHGEHAELLGPLLAQAQAWAPAALLGLGLALLLWNRLRAANSDLFCGLDAEAGYRADLALRRPDAAHWRHALWRLQLAPALALPGLCLALVTLGPVLTLTGLLAATLLAWLLTGLMVRLFPGAAQPRLRLEMADSAAVCRYHGPSSFSPAPAPVPMRPRAAPVPARRPPWAPLDASLAWLVCGLLIAAVGVPELLHAVGSALPASLQLVLAIAAGAVLGADLTAAGMIGAALLAGGVPGAAVIGFALACLARLPRRLPVLLRLHGRRFAATWAGLWLALTALAGSALLPLLPSVPAAAAVNLPGLFAVPSLLLLALAITAALLRRGGRELFAALFMSRPG